MKKTEAVIRRWFPKLPKKLTPKQKDLLLFFSSIAGSLLFLICVMARIHEHNDSIAPRESYLVAKPQKIPLVPDNSVSKTIIVEGTGDQPDKGDKVTVHLVGTVPNGEEFNSSRKRNEPLNFTVGESMITGMEIALKSMKVGERSIFSIGFKYAHGYKGVPPKIKSEQDIIFDIELLSMKKVG